MILNWRFLRKVTRSWSYESDPQCTSFAGFIEAGLGHWELSGRGPMGFRRFAPASLPLRGLMYEHRTDDGGP